MSKRLVSLGGLLALMGLMLAVLPFGGTSEAAQVAGSVSSSNAAVKPAILKMGLVEVEGAEKPTGPGLYIVTLADEPLATYTGGITNLAPTSPKAAGTTKVDADSPASTAYRNYLTQQRNQVLTAASQLLARIVDPLHIYEAATNGFAASFTHAEAAKIAALPGVVRVERSVNEKPLTDVGPAFIGAPAIWDGTSTNGMPGTKGEGIIVGVIDSGINLDHPSFADVGGDTYDHSNPRGAGNYRGACDPTNLPAYPGNPSGYNPAIVCNDKLIGAWTWPETNVPGSPEDEDGHGSHTASTAAGNALTNAVIDTYAVGPISGVAPHANIIAYDVCGFINPDATLNPDCPNTASVKSVDQAVLDGVDVINFSISGGSNPYTDAVEQAFLRARFAGIFVSTSAGNSGPGASTVAHRSPWLMSVAATTHNRTFNNTLTDITGTGATPPETLTGKAASGEYGPAPIVYAGNLDNPNEPTPANERLCLQPYPAGFFTGQIVICDRGVNARTDKGLNVEAGGAGGLILTNTSATQSVNADFHYLPAVHIDNVQGDQLKAFLAAATDEQGRITASTKDLAAANGDIVASFSSRGPSATLPDILKPDAAAPGVDIIAAVASNGARTDPAFDGYSGTSMASPHNAGAGALLKALHPDWTNAEIQSALMTTAINSGVRKENGTTPADPFDIGAGRINLANAGRAGLTLDETQANYEAANPATGGDLRTLNLASLADYACIDVCTWTRTVKSRLAASSTWTATATGFNSVTVTPATFTLAPGATQVLTIQADLTGLSRGVYRFGSVTLTESGNLAASATMPIAAKNEIARLPGRVDIVTSGTSGSQASGNIYAVEITNLTVREYGLTRATLVNRTLPQDSDNGNVLDNLSDGVFVEPITVPAGTKRLVAEITQTAAEDIDLYVFQDGANGNPADLTPQEDELVGASATGEKLEYVNLPNPTSGTYLILVQNYQSSAPGASDSVTLAMAAVPNTDLGNMNVTGPQTVPARTPFQVQVAYSLPEQVAYNSPAAVSGDRYYGAFDLGTDPANAGNLGTIEVNLDGIAQAPTPTMTQTSTTAPTSTSTSEPVPTEPAQQTATETKMPATVQPTTTAATTATTAATTTATTTGTAVTNRRYYLPFVAKP